MRRPSTSLLRSSSRALKRWWAVILACASLWLLWRAKDHLQTVSEPSLGRAIRHLHAQALLRQKIKLERQSATLPDARTEYTRRYGLSPPDGFDAWFTYAKSRSSPIIDDYDDLMADLRPYRNFHSSHCDTTANKVYSSDIVRVCVAQRQVFVDGQQQDALKPFLNIVNELLTHLPDLCLVVNTLDTPRTVLNHATIAALLGPVPPTTCEIQHFEDASRRNIWSEVTQSCLHDSSARNDLLKRDTSFSHLKTDWTTATDLCSRTAPPPSGLILAPENVRLSSVVRPVLSGAVLATFHDVRYPAATHIRSTMRGLTDWKEWDDKQAMLSWRGDSSGGWASALNWHELQRQRMVALGHKARPNAFASPPKTGTTLRQQPRTYQNRKDRKEKPRLLTDLLDVKFTNYTSCEWGVCDVMRKELSTEAPIESENRVFDSKLVLSMDGSGADTSGLYAALMSNSAVIRQGLLREWHDADSRLVPWLHYIPLSMEMDELPGLLSFLLKDGESIVKTIASEGSEWMKRALRYEDMKVYIFRLLIEMGRRDFSLE